MTNKYEQLLREQDKALQAGDVEKTFSYFADDVVAHIGGKSKISGDVKGRDQLIKTFEMFMTALGPNGKIETHDIVANDKHGIVLQSFVTEYKGERVTLGGVAIFHFSGDKISEAWLFDQDPYTADPIYDAALK